MEHHRVAVGVMAIPDPGSGWLIVLAGACDPRQHVRVGQAVLRTRAGDIVLGKLINIRYLMAGWVGLDRWT